jgi:hypothetical protein
VNKPHTDEAGREDGKGKLIKTMLAATGFVAATTDLIEQVRMLLELVF